MRETIEQNWERLWKDILTKEDGSLDLEQIKKELYDYSFLLEEVPKVYDTLSGGVLSYPHYKADVVIDAVEERMDQLLAQALKEEQGSGGCGSCGTANMCASCPSRKG